MEPRDRDAQIGLICNSLRAGFADADQDQADLRVCFSSHNRQGCCVRPGCVRAYAHACAGFSSFLLLVLGSAPQICGSAFTVVPTRSCSKWSPVLLVSRGCPVSGFCSTFLSPVFCVVVAVFVPIESDIVNDCSYCLKVLSQNCLQTREPRTFRNSFNSCPLFSMNMQLNCQHCSLKSVLQDNQGNLKSPGFKVEEQVFVLLQTGLFPSSVSSAMPTFLSQFTGCLRIRLCSESLLYFHL